MKNPHENWQKFEKIKCNISISHLPDEFFLLKILDGKFSI